MSNSTWLGKLTRLNKARDNAPHKPLFLLVFLEMVEKHEYTGGVMRLTPELAYRFDTFFKVVQYRRSARPNVRMPFHHLKTQGFWGAFTDTGETSNHYSSTAYIVPDPDFVEACRSSEFRHQARLILIVTHFEPAERNALYHLVGIRIPKADKISQNAFFDQPHDAEKAGRSARFRLDVVSAYDFTCALTGYRVTTVAAGAIVDAAHIHWFSESRNDDLNNGIALCKNAHWQFDAGLWTIDDDYRVIVAKEAFSESSPNQKPLAEMHGQRLLLPQADALWPSKTHLAWHRAHRFIRCA